MLSALLFNLLNEVQQDGLFPALAWIQVGYLFLDSPFEVLVGHGDVWFFLVVLSLDRQQSVVG